MFGKFFEKINKPKEQLPGPREINFENGVKLEIFFEGVNREPQFKLTKNGTEIHDFKTDAPEGTRTELSPKNKWEADSGSKTIHVGQYKDVDGILSFLHEAGHLNDEVSADLVFTAKRRHAEEMIEDKMYHYPDKRLLAMSEEKRAVISAERNAWAFALKKTRQLEKEFGISILKRIGKVDDVVKHVNHFLNTYEQPYLIELYNIDIFTKEEMEKLFAEIEKQPKLETRG
jgi:hypothetical protein